MAVHQIGSLVRGWADRGPYTIACSSDSKPFQQTWSTTQDSQPESKRVWHTQYKDLLNHTVWSLNTPLSSRKHCAGEHTNTATCVLSQRWEAWLPQHVIVCWDLYNDIIHNGESVRLWTGGNMLAKKKKKKSHQKGHPNQNMLMQPHKLVQLDKMKTESMY